MSRTYDWRFPLPRTHTGVLLGNGNFGALIWGHDNVLRITIGRTDYWDHRGGMPWREGMSYANIRRLLEARDEEGLRRLFERTSPAAGEPERPTVLPIGRVEIALPPGYTLATATLDIDSAQFRVRAIGDRSDYSVLVDLSMERPLLCLQLPEGLERPEVRAVPAWEYVGDHLSAISFRPPVTLAAGDLHGWLQERPADPCLCVGYRFSDESLWLAADYGDSPAEAREAASALIAEAISQGANALRNANCRWWDAYWSATPRVSLPNPVLQFAYDYGMYKFASFTNPEAVPATLQGAWIEEYQMPPWSSDYHFNINVQMCYWPAYRGNQLAHLRPLFEMIAAWEPLLRENARVFLGIDDGYMLPHAVDDRGTCMGGFWTGSVDHGCTAWVAHMMYTYWRYSGDIEFLRRRAYPFMVGAMRVYEEMLEEDDGRFRLPVSVSPEFRGAGLDAWGANASFQLACIHWLCEALLEAATALGVEPKPVWQRIRQGLPRASLYGPDSSAEIALWDGLPLRESHRHHSHLAGFYPFDVIPAASREWAGVVERSIAAWVREGMGLWSGWAMPWAAILHSRVGNPDQAELALEIWDRVFTNEGHGTLHDCQFSGFTLMGRGATGGHSTRPEIMQMDAGMGAAAAVMELLLQTRGGVNYLFAGAPQHWQSVIFERLRTEGAFLVSARREGGILTSVVVESELGGFFSLANPWPGAARVTREGRDETIGGDNLRIAMSPGQSVTLAQA